MASQRLGKSDDLRVFAQRDLERRVSVTGPLRLAGATVDGVCRELRDKGLLLSAGRGKHACSSDGAVLKHRFNKLRDYLRLRSMYAVVGDTVEQIDGLREYMRMACEGVPF